MDWICWSSTSHRCSIGLRYGRFGGHGNILRSHWQLTPMHCDTFLSWPALSYSGVWATVAFLCGETDGFVFTLYLPQWFLVAHDPDDSLPVVLSCTTFGRYQLLHNGNTPQDLHLHLHLVIWQTLLSKATYNWGIHKAIYLEEAIRQRKCS